MKKSYSYFNSIEDIKELGLQVFTNDLFPDIQISEPSSLLLQILKAYKGTPIESEKAKSEFLIAPILNEVRLSNPKKMTFFSGYQFNVDKKRGLTGYCDYIVSKKYNAAFIESPILAVVEAKSNQDLLDATPQCIAEMYAAQLFNERNKETIPIIYGIVTNGYEWLFLMLENGLVNIDTERFSLDNLPKLLGVWSKIVS